MDTLLFWLLVGLLGFVLYISPGFLIYRMYESFSLTPKIPEKLKATVQPALNQARTTATNVVQPALNQARTAATNVVQPVLTRSISAATVAPVLKEVNATGPTTANLVASTAPTQASPTANQIQNLYDLLNTPIPSVSPTAPMPVAGSVGAIARPIEHESIRSQPMPTREAPVPSQALIQGDLYKTTLPPIPAPGVQGMMGAMGTQPATQGSAPAERIVYIERPSHGRDCDNDRCDKPAANPNCPDMRDYIRKDSIPCWGCKLR